VSVPAGGEGSTMEGGDAREYLRRLTRGRSGTVARVRAGVGGVDYYLVWGEEGGTWRE